MGSPASWKGCSRTWSCPRTLCWPSSSTSSTWTLQAALIWLSTSSPWATGPHTHPVKCCCPARFVTGSSQPESLTGFHQQLLALACFGWIDTTFLLLRSGGFFLICQECGKMLDHSFPTCAFFIFFLLKISFSTLIALFRPESVHSDSASWDGCDRVFPDELHVSLSPGRFPHYAWTAAQSARSDFVASRVFACLGVTCHLHFGRMTGVFYVPLWQHGCGTDTE